MIQYKYHRAASLDDVVKVLKEYGGKARIVAGERTSWSRFTKRINDGRTSSVCLISPI